MKKLFYFIVFWTVAVSSAWAQSVQVKGVILNNSKEPVAEVKISDGKTTVFSNQNGFYFIDIPTEAEITYQKNGFKTSQLFVNGKNNELIEINVLLLPEQEDLEEIIIDKEYQNLTGTVVIPPSVLRKIPGANPGIENILKTLPGVYSNNELSTQYAVRGGNYDENAIYVNEVEVYRPFLIRSGKQEGLSFVNSDMIENIEFSAGGFQAKYGDKLASVLDITYRIPTRFKTMVEASFLGTSATIDLVSTNQKWSSVTGVRYRNNHLLVNKDEEDGSYRPSFTDVQTSVNFIPSKKWQFNFLGNISANQYKYKPVSRQTRFGTIDEVSVLNIYYQGREEDKYTSVFGALKAAYKVNEHNSLKWITSLYHTQEQEYYDILAAYRLTASSGNSDNNQEDWYYSEGNVKYTEGVGSQLNHARNDYDALIFNAEMKGIHELEEHLLEWGIKYSAENIRDRMVEWEVLDSLGFHIPNPNLNIVNTEPYAPNEGPLAPFFNVRVRHTVNINRLGAFVQWSKQFNTDNADIYLNAGIRAQWWNISENKSQTGIAFSPRTQIAVKPYWTTDMVFRLSAGLYQQPPSYREYRAMNGSLNLDLKAQKSLDFVLGHDYSFKLWERPFKLQTEVYYKYLTDVNTYTLDNVRIRYQADNNAKAYVYGADMRLYGEFVPGTESWLSFGYLKTEENYNNRGYIARPTDQRLKFGMLFQDYMPQIPNLKLYLNLVYNTGLIGGSPSYSDPYDYQMRLKDYRRADIGFSYVFKDSIIGQNKNWLRKIEELQFGFEIFNLFDNQNAITNTWVRDTYSKRQYAVPNYMTGRTFNLKVNLTL